jgi:hypothetical protein
MVVEHPPRPMSFLEHVRQGRRVENDWILHRKHPDLSPHRLPLRWGPVTSRVRDYSRMLRDRSITQGKPTRMLRVVALGTGMTVVALATACRRWPDGGAVVQEVPV